NRAFQGSVARLAEKLNLDTRTMETEVDVANPRLELVPGMYAYASMTTEQARGVLVVPVQAIDRKDDKAAVVIVGRDGRTAVRAITIGLEAPARVEVRGGLQEGDLVVVGNRAQLKDGSLVAPTTVAPPAEGVR